MHENAVCVVGGGEERRTGEEEKQQQSHTRKLKLLNGY